MNSVFLRFTTTDGDDVGFPADEISFIAWRVTHTEVQLRNGRTLQLNADAGDVMTAIGAIEMEGIAP